MRAVRGSHNDESELVAPRPDLVRRLEQLGSGMLAADGLPALGVARDDGREVEAVDGSDQRRVERVARDAVADERYADRLHCVLGRPTGSPSTVMSTFSLKKATASRIPALSGSGSR